MIVTNRIKKYLIKAVLLLLFSATLAGCAVTYPEDAGVSEETPEKAAGKKSEVEIKDSISHLPIREEIVLDPDWEYALMSEINTGSATLYRAKSDRKGIVIGVNAGHGTAGGEAESVYCHPDRSPKITSGSNPAGSLKAVAVSAGMIFNDGATEAEVALKAAGSLRDKLLEEGYDVLMIRDGDDVQLDNVARTVIANNKADCLISLHWDGDGQSHDKGCFYIPVPDEIKDMEPVSLHWKNHERLGQELIDGLEKKGCIIYHGRIDPLELTQTCYATIPAVVVELGNGASSHEDSDISRLTDGLFIGLDSFCEMYLPQRTRSLIKTTSSGYLIQVIVT